MRHLLTTTCTVTSVTGWSTDAEGESTPTTSTVTTTCHLQPVRAGGGRDAETVAGDLDVRPRWQAWLPDGTTITAQDTITVSGTRYRVHGPPRRWVNPSRSISYLAVDLEEVTP